ncbi:hypothetical protein HDU91_000749 [Kappamyces sp. JEL0680]|nr:hypothetical protein HDU91_000749 [Kappamyces sp. JEL0680]
MLSSSPSVYSHRSSGPLYSRVRTNSCPASVLIPPSYASSLKTLSNGNVLTGSPKSVTSSFATFFGQSSQAISQTDHRLLREVKTLASVSNHSNIVRYYGAWIEQDPDCLDTMSLFIQMELYTCSDLRGWMNQRTAIDLPLNLVIFRQLVDAVTHIHSFGVVHRDIKPENVFVKGDGSIVLGDFGLAKNIEDDSWEWYHQALSACAINDEHDVFLSEEAGTFLYSAPETLESGGCTEASDMYALGIVLFELFMIFQTQMERSVILSDLKSKLQIPLQMQNSYPLVTSLVLALINPCSESRPCASDLAAHPIFGKAMLVPGLAKKRTTLDCKVFDAMSPLCLPSPFSPPEDC